MGVWDDHHEFGRRVAAARGWAGLSQPEFNEAMGKKKARSGTERWEKGDLGKKLNNPEGRRETAQKIIARIGCPPEIFGLNEPEPTAVDHLRQELLQEMDAMKTELLEEIEKALDAQASDQPSQAPGAEG